MDSEQTEGVYPLNPGGDPSHSITLAKDRPLFDRVSRSNQHEDRFRGGTNPLPLAEEFRITADERKQIVAHIKELQPEGGATPF